MVYTTCPIYYVYICIQEAVRPYVRTETSIQEAVRPYVRTETSILEAVRP